MPTKWTYRRSHPWITFELDLRRASHKVWLLLGEAQSKSEHLSSVPLLPVVAKQFHQLFLAKGVLATTAIEGNTLTEKEVMQHLEGKLELPPSKEYLRQEIANILGACNEIGERVLSKNSTDLSVDLIRSFNRQVLDRLPQPEEVTPGEIRKHSVGVGQYRGAPPEECHHLLQRLCDWLNHGFAPPDGYHIAFGLLQAIVAHLYLAWIHPFADGNGRTARLIEFQILLSAGVPTVAAHLLSNHYNQTRAEYYRQLDHAHKSGGDAFPFITYALQGFVDGLREQLHLVKKQQLAVHWINYVHDRFRDQDTPANTRRRRLAIDLSIQSDPVPMAQVRHVTPRIAEAYAGKTDKTIKRDLNVLEEKGLIVRTIHGIRARRETILAFVPTARHQSRSHES